MTWRREHSPEGHARSLRTAVRAALAALVGVGLAAAAQTARAEAVDHSFVTSDGVRLHYIEAGHGHARTLVFVPGWTMPAWIFDKQIDALSSEYRVIALDPRGQGASEIPIGGYDQNRRGQDIAELIARVSPDPVVLVGWSLGVLDALGYVARSGDAHLAGLVLIDNSVGETPAPVPAPPPAHPRPHRPGNGTCTKTFVAGMFAHSPGAAYIDRLADDCARTPAPAARALLHYPVPRSYWRDALYSTQKPVLYVVRPRWEAQAQTLEHNRPNTETVLFEGAGHALFVDEPDRFNAVLRSFLAQHVWPQPAAP